MALPLSSPLRSLAQVTLLVFVKYSFFKPHIVFVLDFLLQTLQCGRRRSVELDSELRER